MERAVAGSMAREVVDAREEAFDRDQIVWFFGHVFSAFGAVLAVPAVLFGLYEGSIQLILPVGFAGLMLGFLGWCCDSNKLGSAVMALSIIAVFLGLSISQGGVEGISATDPANRDAPNGVVADSGARENQSGEYARLTGAAASDER